MTKFKITSFESDRIYVADAKTAVEALAHLDMIDVIGLPPGTVIECFTTNVLQRSQLVELAEAEERSGQTLT